MSDEGIESRIPDLTGVSLAELRRNPKYAKAARVLAEELLGQPDDGVIICCDPLNVATEGSVPKKR